MDDFCNRCKSCTSSALLGWLIPSTSRIVFLSSSSKPPSSLTGFSLRQHQESVHLPQASSSSVCRKTPGGPPCIPVSTPRWRHRFRFANISASATTLVTWCYSLLCGVPPYLMFVHSPCLLSRICHAGRQIVQICAAASHRTALKFTRESSWHLAGGGGR